MSGESRHIGKFCRCRADVGPIWIMFLVYIYIVFFSPFHFKNCDLMIFIQQSILNICCIKILLCRLNIGSISTISISGRCRADIELLHQKMKDGRCRADVGPMSSFHNRVIPLWIPKVTPFCKVGKGNEISCLQLNFAMLRYRCYIFSFSLSNLIMYQTRSCFGSNLRPM